MNQHSLRKVVKKNLNNYLNEQMTEEVIKLLVQHLCRILQKTITIKFKIKKNKFLSWNSFFKLKNSHFLENNKISSN